MRPDVFRRFQVRNCPRQFQDSCIRPRAQPQSLHSRIQKTVRVFPESAILLDMPRLHLSVAIDLIGPEPFELDASCIYDSFPDVCGFFPHVVGRQFLVWHRRDFDMDVDTVQERPGYPPPVPVDLPGTACALMTRVA